MNEMVKIWKIDSNGMYIKFPKTHMTKINKIINKDDFMVYSKQGGTPSFYQTEININQFNLIKKLLKKEKIPFEIMK